MKKIFIADTDETFQASINSLVDGKSVKVEIFSSSMDVLPEIEKEHPAMIYVNLELPDMNDFVMYDLLKKADMTPPIPVLITYSEQSEKDLGKYKKLKFKPEGYHKKPLSDEDIESLLSRHLGTAPHKKEESGDKPVNKTSVDFETTAEEEDGVIFTQVPAEIDEKPKPAKNKTSELKHGVFQVSDGDAEMVSKTGKDLAERVISLEKQNRFLRDENKGLSQEIEALKKEFGKKGEVKDKERSQAEKNAKELEEKLHNIEEEYKTFKEKAETEKAELTDKITDMQREMVAKDHEFEKKLNEETNSMLQQAEQRLINDFRETEERLRTDIGRLENEKSRVEAAHMKELDAQKDINSQLQGEIDALKDTETSLNASISALKDEKTAISLELKDAEKKIKTLEEEKESFNQRLMCSEEDLENMTKDKDALAQKLTETETKRAELETREEELLQEKDELLKQKEQKESELSGSIDKLSEELADTSHQLNDHKDRVEKLQKLLLKAVSLTQTGH